ncbi:MAG: nucleoside triphosphate pyrophosphohydrolase family protein [Campylobacterales bacterium]|nr:nucleoside triphosphate pyrophosphohydrolase family protein [Campylobacterales bacterium]
MTFEEYQATAFETDQNKNKVGIDNLTIPLLGIVGEAGSLMTEYKKKLRDGDAHRLFEQHIKEELGDILWYLSNIASKLDFDLEEIAAENLAKLKERWPSELDDGKDNYFFDADFPEDEQLPRVFHVCFKDTGSDSNKKVKISINGVFIGDPLTDNHGGGDGYRFHDIFHFAYAAVLGWSPIVRRMLKLKRKSKPKTDEIEDGARAFVTEEAISALVFEHAKNNEFYDGINGVDYNLLKTIKMLIGGFEVNDRSLGLWEKAILEGFNVYRKLLEHDGGNVKVNLQDKTLSFENEQCTQTLNKE